MDTAIVLSSGGIDSCVLTCLAGQENDLALLHISYGQRAQQQERQAFEKQAKHFKPKHVLNVELPHLARIGGSSLTDPRLPIENSSDLGGQIPNTYLPFGFPTFWAVAASWAQVIGARKIFFGAVADHGVRTHPAGMLEPSLKRECLYLFDQLAELASKPDLNLRFETPLYDLSRNEIIALGQRLQAPLQLTWSCYHQGPDPCLQCYRCVIRREGFHQTGMADPAAKK